MKIRRSKKRTLFNPDKIATAISQTLSRDLAHSQQLYGVGNSVQKFYSETWSREVLKKYDSTTSDVDKLEEEAYASFIQNNDRMRQVNVDFRPPRQLPAHHLSSDELMLKRAQHLISWVLGDITWGEIADNARNSSGVTLGVRFSDTSNEAKFTWPMSTTAEVASMFNQYLNRNVMLRRAIESFNGTKQLDVARYDIVEASRATTVPKSSTKRRMIAIEPTLNMFFQQGLMHTMYKRLKGSRRLLTDVRLDVESLPTKHQDLARWASITGNNATIDFSSASDCVSIELLRYLLPPKWFKYVTILRSPFMKIKEELVELQMVSTMGNAGTFPLETLVFWSLGVAAVMNRTEKNPYTILSKPQDRNAVSVFGDDCILPTEDAHTFMDMCTKVGFIVNKEKSFYDKDSRFRESCGGDYLQSSYVRPLHVKAPTSTRLSALEPWLYIILNGVLKKYEMYFGRLTYLYDKQLLQHLFSLFKKHKLKVKLVPLDFPDDAGLKTLDWRRLAECYSIDFDTIHISESGWRRFRYLHFRYTDRAVKDDGLMYANWLQKPKVTRLFADESPAAHIHPLRRKGGYVVAKTTTPYWE
jgi:hypothetical protein